jgi:hypothetical protein
MSYFFSDALLFARCLLSELPLLLSGSGAPVFVGPKKRNGTRTLEPFLVSGCKTGLILLCGF